MAEFSDREHLFRTWYGDNPTADHYKGHGPEPDSRIAFREILRLREEILRLKGEEARKTCGHGNLGWIGFSGKMYCHDCSLIVDERFHHRLCDGYRCETLNCNYGDGKW